VNNTIDHQPGDGWRYVVAVSPLPHDGFEGGGDVDDYALVSVWVPGDSLLPDGVARTRVMARTGYLADHYVAEKFGTGLDSARIRHVTDAIRLALDRPEVSSDAVERLASS
jgi:hypothetical protein